MMRMPFLLPGRARRARGFTLIELLVVIAIIAILAAILFPVFAKARERAKMSTCISNVKQIATAIRMYADDNADYFVTTAAPSATGLQITNHAYGGVSESRRPLYPYTANDQNIFKCPSDIGGPGDHGVPDWKNRNWTNSYVMNAIIMQHFFSYFFSAEAATCSHFRIGGKFAFKPELHEHSKPHK